jgi:hypothetical protein
MKTAVSLPVQILMLCVACVTLSLAAGAPQLVNVQGLLTNSGDEPVADGTYEVTFAIYDDDNSGSALWTEVRNVTTEDGLFTIILGETSPLPESLFDIAELWLGITVSGDTEMTPRQRLTSVPYALNTPEGESPADTGNNVVTGLWAAIAGGTSNRADGDSSFIGGGALNEVTGAGATIAGGVKNFATGLHACIGGGGGRSGADSNVASGNYSTISGGRGNEASDWNCTVGGGYDNRADGTSATVGGGSLNEATGGHSVVCGGTDNTATAGQAAVVGGGHNEASALDATVGGGYGNEASGEYSTVGGGSYNEATGANSTTPGGYNNSASGESSCAMGHNASAVHDGSFVWGDARAAIVESDTTNQFKIRAENGLCLESNKSGGSSNSRIGSYYRDNAIVAWGNVNGSGSIGASFGVSMITHNDPGVYSITLNISTTGSDPDLLVMTASAEVDAIPTGVTSARLIYVDQIDANTFNVYITDGNHAAKDNEFTFIATAR